MSKKAICNCFCHDLDGGYCHVGQKCICNGGEGYDDTSGWFVNDLFSSDKVVLGPWANRKAAKQGWF